MENNENVVEVQETQPEVVVEEKPVEEAVVETPVEETVAPEQEVVVETTEA